MRSNRNNDVPYNNILYYDASAVADVGRWI